MTICIIGVGEGPVPEIRTSRLCMKHVHYATVRPRRLLVVVIEVVIIRIVSTRLDIKVNNSASESWVVRPTLPRNWQLNNLRDNLSVRLSPIFLSNNL
jgi:hypothetical protein